jgi:hypothetical protein
MIYEEWIIKNLEGSGPKLIWGIVMEGVKKTMKNLSQYNCFPSEILTEYLPDSAWDNLFGK